MSRITALTLTPARLRFRAPVRYATRTITSLDIGILRLATDDGLVGLGEVTGPLPRGDVGAAITPEVVAMIGRDPADMVAAEAGIFGGALATAALDVLGQRQGRSLVALLGGGSDSVAVNGLLVIGQATPDVDARDAAEIVSSGFQTIKVKPAIGAAQRSVTDSLWAVRERLGASVAIRLDLNGARAERAVIDWLVSLETLRLEYVEQPIAPALGVRAMARVRAVIPMDLAVDESVTDEDAAGRLMDAGACDVLIIKPGRVGGPMTSVRIARAAAAAGVGVTVSTLYDSGVGLACALHVAATIPGDGAHGLSTAALFVSDLVGAGLPISGGRMSLPRRPGLGVTLDTSAMSAAAADALDALAEAGADVAVLGVIDPLAAVASARPDDIALVDAAGQRTWREVLEDASGLATRLGSTGERVALLARDTADSVVAIHAVRLAGATLVPLNRRLTNAELAAMVQRSRVSRLIHDATHARVAGELASALPALDLVPLPGRSLLVATILPRVLDRGAIGACVFTSGTTGVPRAALLSHANLLASAAAWNRFLEAGPRDHWLATLPLSHVAGLGVVLRCAGSGARLTVHDHFDAGAIRERLAGGGITLLSLVPTQLMRLLDDGPVAAPELRALLLGGAPIPAGLVRRAVAAGLPIVPTYGLTETASGVTAALVSEVEANPGSSGRALPELRVRVVGDDGRDMSVGVVGNVTVSGATVFVGYDRDPIATDAVLQDGWLHTGDLGALDGEGRLTIVDRREDLIISGGENISPVEVESVLALHPDVLDAAVIGRPDDVWGAVPVALLVPRPGVSLDIDRVTGFARDRLAGYKVPVAIEIVSVIPRTASGKIVRGDVRKVLGSGTRDLFVERPGGARIHVRRRGTGPVLVLLHATLSNAQELDPLAMELADAHMVLAIDRRSSGGSVMPPDDVLGPIDVQVHIDDILAVVDELVPGEPVFLVGHSYGGCVGLELAARHPERVSGAFLFEPPYLSVVPDGGADSEVLAERITDIARRDGLGAAALAFLETVNGAGITRRLPADALARFEREGRAAVADSALAGFDPTGLVNVRARLGIGLGERSRGPYAAVAAGIAVRIPALQIHTFPTLGHGGPVSQPATVAPVILALAGSSGPMASLVPAPGGSL